MHYSIESRRKWLKSRGVWRKVRVKKKRKITIETLQKSWGIAVHETSTWYLPMRGLATDIKK